MRILHSWAGLLAALVVTFLALTGAILSVQPAIETLAGHAFGATVSVAELAGKVSVAVPGVERITRSASGMVVAYFAGAGGAGAEQVEPSTGAVIGPYGPSPFFSFITELHRSLFFGDLGHGVAGVASVGIAILALSGLMLLAKRSGGWRRLFAPAKGSGSQRLHARLARVVVTGLVLTALSGAYMSAVNFGFLPDGTSLGLSFPPQSSGGAPGSVGSLEALAATPLSELRELVFPANGDSADVFTLSTAAGQGFIDQSTGALLSFTPNNIWQQLYEVVYTLHTGQGLWWLGLLLGGVALAVPAMAATGVAIWYGRQRNRVALPANASWRSAETVILVGSEANSTLSFAASLHATLTAAGQRVHTAPMNSLRVYPQAKRLLVLTATYGDGDAPASARLFLARLDKLRAAPAPAVAVLGFGDRSFPSYCAYAGLVAAAFARMGVPPLLAFASVDRQSGQDFALWGRHLGAALGIPLTLSHAPVRPRTHPFALIERADFGAEVQAPISILRFGSPSRLPRFAAGDLVGIVPPGDIVPRYYSIASDSSEGLLEICVRRQAGGVCSEFLHGLETGARIEAFVRRNPDFRPSEGRKPLILIGAGSGIAPLVGFVRGNRRHRPVYMFFGARHPGSDFLYEHELADALEDGTLTRLETAFSRVEDGRYVQDGLLAHADLVRQLVAGGAQILVCGGLEMAKAVRATIDRLLVSSGETTGALKAKGRYVEDAY